MHYLILVLCTLLAACAAQPTLNTTEPLNNSTDSNKDMGHQEAVTFFKTNGTGIDLGNISTPLMTNVTAQSLVGVAPATAQQGQTQLSWTALQNLAGLQNNDMKKERKTRRSDEESQPRLTSSVPFLKGVTNESQHIINSKDEIPMKIEKGVAVVPDKAGVKSLSIPPLISFNNNFSDIPVPIPNTSVVHYAKVNTLVQTP